MKRYVFLASDTIRSKCYAQYLETAGIRMAKSILIRSQKSKFGQKSISEEPPEFSELQVPDYRIDLKHTLRSISDECVELISNTVNTEEVVLHLKDGYDYAIFSGFGGEIVKDDVLAAAPPLIHVHAGDLPQFRGSTTFYYSILLNSSILGVSSIFLDQNIDTGKILSKRSFPLPPPNLDIDYYYDPMMRSACLIQTLTEINTELLLPVDNPFPQDSEYYFIMHPLLRHVAINKIKGVQTLKIFE